MHGGNPAIALAQPQALRSDSPERSDSPDAPAPPIVMPWITRPAFLDKCVDLEPGIACGNQKARLSGVA